MSDSIPRFKPKSDWTSADFLNAQRGGDPPETDQYVQARRDALADAGLVDEGEHESSDDEYLETSAGYLRKINNGESLS
jgi:hypothetical protein